VVPPGQLPLQPEFESAGWWASHAYPFGRHPETGEAVRMLHTETEAPGWNIEELHYEPRGEAVAGTEIEGVAYYRILSRGAGGAAGIAVTESIVARPWGGDIEAAPFPPDPGPPVFCAQFEGLHDCGRLAWRRRR
jgi:hypothetical protein